MNNRLVIVFQEDEELNNALQQELKRIDPQAEQYVSFTRNSFSAQQGACIARAILSCNKLERGYHSALHLAALCKAENYDLIFITWSELEVQYPRGAEYIDAHIGRSETTAGVEIPAVAEILSGLVNRCSLKEIYNNHPSTIRAPHEPEHAFC